MLNLQVDPSIVAQLEDELVLAHESHTIAKANYEQGIASADAMVKAQHAYTVAKGRLENAQRQLELRRKLLKLETQKAELDVQAARSAWERLHAFAQAAPGTFSQQELDQARLSMRKAEINLQQLQAIADSLK